MKLKVSMLLAAFSVFFASTAFSADIKIGIAGPFTGAYAAFGEQLTRGAQKAVDDINAKGGIKGKKIVLVQGDDQCDPKQAINVANKLVDQDRIKVMVGHFCSSSTIPASEVYDEAGIVQITPASTNPKVTDRGLPNIFRTCGRDDQQGRVAGKFIAKTLKAKKVAVIHDKDTYGQGLADATKEALNKYGLKEVLYEGLTRGEKDFNALVTKIKGARADLVYFGGLHAEAGVLVKQLREQGWNGPFVSGDGIASAEFVDVVGGPANTKNVFLTFLKDPAADKKNKKILASFKADGYDPEGFTLYAYAAIQVIARAAAKVGTNGDKLSKELKSKGFNTVLGRINFDSKGDPKSSAFVPYKWGKNKAGKFTYIGY